MSWTETLIAGMVSSTAVVAVTAFVLRESFKRLLDARMETLKHRLGIDAKRHEVALSSQIRFKERQLSEFYGPIYAILKRGRSMIYPHWMAGDLDAIDKQLRELSVASNNRIAEIILTKSHLIAGDTIPESFIRYLTHVAVWHAFLETEHRGVPLPAEKFPEFYYPIEFEEEVYGTTEKLKRELDSLHRRYGLVE